MTPSQLQFLIGTPVDGDFGTKSRARLKAKFTNKNAKAVTPEEIRGFASRLGCSEKQMRAVSVVESRGSGYDDEGKPKILYERHIFHRLTAGKWSPSIFSRREGGGYKEDSWSKLGLACAVATDAAFSSCSWGKFQVMGMWWAEFGFSSSYELALSTAGDEVAHYELFVRFIEHNRLQDELRAISTNPKSNVPFVLAYNGKNGVEQNQYDQKLAAQMR